jgi:glycogen(starch) synthase
MTDVADTDDLDAQTPGPPPLRLGAPSETSLLFEVSWEVCAQVGGIYTVLRSKAPATVRRWGDAYFLVGPYRESGARVELEHQAPPEVVRGAISRLEQSGVRTHFGRWLIAGRPHVLLIDASALKARLAEIKYFFWKDIGISSPAGDSEYDDTLCFGVATADFLAAMAQHAGQQPLLAHFHEWQAAAALPLLRQRGVPLATIFTTHATLVGRSLAAANADLYGNLSSIDAGAVARAHGFAHRHALEGSAAQSADVFTTVSAITAQEAEQFLDRRADILLPNGLNIERFAAPHEFQVLHRQNKETIHEFVMGHFFPSYQFDLDKTLYMFSSGRYEYRNKGLDVFIEALRELNRRMQAENSAKTVVAFIITRAPYRALNVETLNRQAMFQELHTTCETIQQAMGERLFYKVATGHLPAIGDLLDEYATVHLKRMIYAMQRQTLPTIVTHDLVDDAHDPVLQGLRSCGLWNRPEDRVKVVFHPEFMSSTSPLLPLEYDQFVRGCHLGVFPSYYEPWGYTPLECVVCGIPAITSDLSGFGQFVMHHFPDHDAEGIFVARRRTEPFAAAVAQVADWMHGLTHTTRRQRIALRNRVESHAEEFDWNRLEQHYAAARRLALQKHYGVGRGAR